MAPIRLIGPADESLWPPGARRLRDRYGMRSFVASTDADGFRTTLPVRSGPEVVLLIGDSMAWGSGLDDSETLTSILQPKAPELRFVNAGVVTAQTPDNLAHLAEHLRAFGGRVRVVLYFFSETDMYSVYPDWPERSAGELVEAVRQICADHGVDRLVWIHGLTMSSTLPDVPAAFGGGSLREANRAIEAAMLYRRDVLSATEVLRIPVVDTFALVEAYRVEQQNHLAGLALYNDGMHFSREGMRRIAAEVVPHLPPSEDQTLSR
jgi:hypothetical protein